MQELNTSPLLTTAAISQDHIGWDNFMQGKTSVIFHTLQRHHYQALDSRRSSSSWASNLVRHLLLFVHQLWNFRNENVHKRGADGLLIKEAATLRQKIKTHLSLDTSHLLQEDQHLLRYKESVIHTWPSGKRKLWLTAVEAT